MSSRRIALFGMFRSGTNYTRTILEWNYDCEIVSDAYAWKHGFFPIIVDRSQLDYLDMDIIYVTKNPFANISSLYKYFRTNGRNIHTSKEWKEFLRQRFIIYDSFQENSPQYRFANVVDYWNSMNWNLSSFDKAGFNSIHACYTKLLSKPVEQSRKIASQLSLTPKFSSEEEFKTPDNVTKNMGDKPRYNHEDYLTPRPFDSTMYTNKKYLELFDRDDRKFVLKNIDLELAFKLGYSNELVTVRNSI